MRSMLLTGGLTIDANVDRMLLSGEAHAAFGHIRFEYERIGRAIQGGHRRGLWMSRPESFDLL